MRFRNKIALVTGGTSGIGRAIVELLVAEGATVYFIGRDNDKAKLLLSELSEKKYSGRTQFIACDIADKNAKCVIGQAIELYNIRELDILVNNAGIWKTPDLQDITRDIFDEIYAINTWAPMMMTQLFLEMLKKRNGNIVNVASNGGLQSHIAGSKQYLYASSKAAFIEFSQLCSLNFAKEVRVNCVCPGITETPMHINRDFSRFNTYIPMGRVASPKEVANVVLFLASDAASFVNGAVVTADGGAALV